LTICDLADSLTEGRSNANRGKEDNEFEHAGGCVGIVSGVMSSFEITEGKLGKV